MSTSTLTSLALLKVNVDQRKDYLDYLRPFILQVLMDHRPDRITGNVITKYIREQFDLEIPERTVEIVLKRISKQGLIKREHGVYQMTGDLPDPQLSAKQSNAERHITSVLHGLRKFSKTTIKPISSDADAVVAICAFLAEFDITCLRAYLRGTAIPSLEGSPQTNIVLVSDYVQHVRRTDPERFESFIVLVQGHMLANALMCPDLAQAPMTYQRVTFYFDTPLLLQRLGLEGEAKGNATRELISLLKKLGGKVAAFSHSRDELARVLEGAAAKVDAQDGRGTIVFEARRNGTTRSDLLLFAESIDDKLADARIEVLATPHYIKDSQIDESVFEHTLDDGVSYQNPRAKEYDINSVRSIYVIRANKPAPSVERARAVFVTSNAAFAKAAWEYGQRVESSQDVSSVITDFSLANTAWLKVPMGAPSIPKTQVLAFSYAALKPSDKLLGKFMTEIERLETQGKITERDHQLLRSSPLVYDELGRLTLGEVASLTEETVKQIYERVSNEIRTEGANRLAEEQGGHQETLNALDTQLVHNQTIMSNLYWRCHSRAKILAWVPSVVIGIALLLGLSFGWGLDSANRILTWSLIGGYAVLTVLTLTNLVFGTSVRRLHEWVHNQCLTWLLNREAKAIGISSDEFNTE